MSSRDNQQRKRGGGGPIGGLIKLVGTGVGAAVEYRGHRKERKAAHDSAHASPDEQPAVAGPSSRPNISQHSSSTNLPPTYSELASSASDRQFARGPPVGDEKKVVQEELSDSDSSSELSLIEDDEEAWELDEAAAATEPPSYEDATGEDDDALVRDVVGNRPADTKPVGKLPLPVILPQRRPRNKSRGFVRAYSPVLEDVGIDQQTFLRFLKNFHKSSQANPYFNAVLVAATVAGFVPEPITMAVTTAVQVAAGVGKEIDSRRKTNTFLDRMNETLFKPAGCYAFIMKYKSDAEVAASGSGLLARFGIGTEKVDFSTTKAIAKYESPSPGEKTSLSAKMNKMRLTSGETRGSLKMVEAAPLVYPAIDEVMYSGKNGEETFKDKTRDAKKFLAGYVDRRVQSKYAQNDPDSALVIPESERQNRSKWSDPNNPMFNGGLIGLVSGGHVDMPSRRAAKRERKMERREAKFERRYGRSPGYPASHGGTYDNETSPSQHPPGQYDQDYFGRGYDRRAHPRQRRGDKQKNGGPIGAIRKVMQEDVLYLMIVPMPSEEELAEAREIIAAESNK